MGLSTRVTAEHSAELTVGAAAAATGAGRHGGGRSAARRRRRGSGGGRTRSRGRGGRSVLSNSAASGEGGEKCDGDDAELHLDGRGFENDDDDDDNGAKKGCVETEVKVRREGWEGEQGVRCCPNYGRASPRPGRAKQQQQTKAKSRLAKGRQLLCGDPERGVQSSNSNRAAKVRLIGL